MGRSHPRFWPNALGTNPVALWQLHEAPGGPADFAVGSHNERPERFDGQSVNAALDDDFAETEPLLLERLSTITPSTLAADFAQRQAKCQASKGQI